MVILKTTDKLKVERHLEILTGVYSKQLTLTERQIYELLCLKYDYEIRKDTCNKLVESELVVRSYNILSTKDTVFTSEDFNRDTEDDFDYLSPFMVYLDYLSSKLVNILVYINTVESLYGIRFKSFRDIKSCHEIVNVFKYGLAIDRFSVLKLEDSSTDIEFLLGYAKKIIPDLRDDIGSDIVYVSPGTKDILKTISNQALYTPFRFIHERFLSVN